MQRGPLVVVVDDTHWADPESLAWVSSFADRVRELQVLMIVAYRPEELPVEGMGLAEAVARNRTRTFDLAPLSSAAVTTLVKDTLGAGADQEFCHEAYLVTGGNPFETVELAARARDRGVAPSQEHVPLLRNMAGTTRVSDVQERLEPMGTDAVRLAWAIALLGAEASVGLAASVAGLKPQAAADAAERLRTGRMLKADAPDGVLEFPHPLIAEAVYRAIPAATRVALHGKVAWELIDSGRGPTAAACHLLETHPEDDPRVVRQLRYAARELLRTGAPDAARRCLNRALREPPPPDQRAALLYELGHPALVQDPGVTVDHLRQALDEPGVTDELREGIVLRLALALGYGGRLTEALHVVEQEAAATADPAMQLRLHAQRFLLGVFSTLDQKEGPARSGQLERLTERLTGRDRTEQCLLALRGWDAVVRGEPAEIALDAAERAVARGMRWTDDEHWGFEAPSVAALTFLACDRPDRARELISDGIAEFERHGWRGAPLAVSYTFLGYIEYRTGRLADAEDFARAGLRLADRVGRGGPVHWDAVGALIEILLARGRIEAAEKLCERYDFAEPFPTAVTVPDARTVRGRLLLARGMTKEAAECLSDNGRRLDLFGPYNPVWCSWLPQFALATHAADPQWARELGQETLKRAVRFGTETAVGQALHVAARLAQGPDVMALLERSVAQLERSPSTYDLACAQVDLGVALRRVGRLSEAADHLYHGVQGAVECGADALAVRARDELAAAGLPPRRLTTES
jgi:tetratricopeptide (TPR) repeat protein